MLTLRVVMKRYDCWQGFGITMNLFNRLIDQQFSFIIRKQLIQTLKKRDL